VTGRVKKVEGQKVVVDFGGIEKRAVAVQEVREGEIVIVHAGLIIGKIKEEDYQRNLEELRLLSTS